MPELPEVETMVRGIRPVLEGSTLVEFVRLPCKRRPLLLEPGLSAIRRRTTGKRIQAVRRRAKRVVIELETGEGFVVEPRMTGLMLVTDPPTVEHLRYAWRVNGPNGIQFVQFWDRRGLGTVRLLDREDRYFGYFAAYNWAIAPQVALTVLAGVLLWTGLFPGALGTAIDLAAMGYGFGVLWFLARNALDLPPGTAALIVAIDVLLNQLVFGVGWLLLRA